MNTALTIGLIAIAAYVLSKSKKEDISAAVDTVAETVGEVVNLTLKYYNYDGVETKTGINVLVDTVASNTTETTYSLTPEKVYDTVISIANNTIEDLAIIVEDDPELAIELYNTVIAKIEENTTSAGMVEGTKEEISNIIAEIVSEIKAEIEDVKSVETTLQQNIDSYVASATKLIKDSWTSFYADNKTRKFYLKLAEPITRRLVIQMSYGGGDFNVDLIASMKYPPTCADIKGNGATGEQGYYFNITDAPVETIYINESLPAGTIIMITACERSGSGDYKIGVFGY